MSASQERKKYTKPRPRVPIDIQRHIRLEAGMRCLVCKAYGVRWQFAHIDHNRENNDPQNLAYLCHICHDEYDNGTKIDRQTIEIAKRKAQAESEEMTKLRVELAQYRQASEVDVSAAYATAREKYSRVFDDLSDKTLFYQGILFLTGSHIRLGESGEVAREAIRSIVSITLPEEEFILEHLAQEGKIEREGDVAILVQNDDAKVAAAEMIEKGTVTVESLLEAFSQYSL